MLDFSFLHYGKTGKLRKQKFVIKMPNGKSDFSETNFLEPNLFVYVLTAEIFDWSTLSNLSLYAGAGNQSDAYFRLSLSGTPYNEQAINI